MSKRGDIEFLGDMGEAIKRIESYTNNMSYEHFSNDIMAQDAVIRNIEIIGEAAKNISSEFKEEHEDIEWRKIAGMRDKII